MIRPVDPAAAYLAHRAEIDEAIRRVLDSGRYVLGEEVAAFEAEFARYLGVRYAIGVGSGTDALHVALRACGVGPGDAVVTVSHTAVATVAAIDLTGARPILMDVEPVTGTLDASRLDSVIKQQYSLRVKAVIPVHLYGHPADMPTIMSIADRHGVKVIEDCAQSHGASLNGRKTGTFGHIAAFSFYPTKNLCALGDGGAVVTNDQPLADQLRLLREYGWRQRYVSEIAGLNTRLDELQAAILRAKLPYLDRENERRRALARRYDAAFANTPLMGPRSQQGAEHVYHQYVVRTDRRDELRSFLTDNGVGTLIHYPVPVHRQPAYQGRVVLDDAGLTATEVMCRRILSLPMHAQLSDVDADAVADSITRWSRRSVPGR
jgi:dTDP-4-amino-4,6-dideoxygalactose transaminase